jgi:hypothetical protein
MTHLHRVAERQAAAGLEGLLTHDLRRSAVRNYVRSGVPATTVMNISSHLTADTFRRYNIIDERDIRSAVEALDQRLPAGLRVPAPASGPPAKASEQAAREAPLPAGHPPESSSASPSDGARVPPSREDAGSPPATQSQLTEAG